jgi:hypothetical protein
MNTASSTAAPDGSHADLTTAQTAMLRSIAAGVRLKDHRSIDGVKTYVLHSADDQVELVSADDVHALVDAGLISSNKKFPAATYWLTMQGQARVARDDMSG